MATIFDVAKYILHKKGEMTTWKLQKLCYYAQAWSLAWTGKPLFDEDFQAWTNGPVCPQLFRLHKGKHVIADIPKGDVNVFTDDEQETLNAIIKGYGDWPPYELREQTHNELPWKKARGTLAEDARCTNVITKVNMGDYYGSL